MNKNRKDNNLKSEMQTSCCQKNDTTDVHGNQGKMSQKEAFSALFSDGQNICFQTKVNSTPIFLPFPFVGIPEAQFFVLNPFKQDAEKRENASVTYRQGITIEQDTITLKLQRTWFHEILGNATVEVFSGGKSIHFHCMFQKALEDAEEAELIELLKKAFPFSDFNVLSDRARLCRVPGTTRDNGKLQEIEYIGDRLDIQTILTSLREKTQHITGIVSVTKSFLKAFYPEGGKKSEFTAENIVSGYSKKVGNREVHVPGLHEALVEMLQFGYPLKPDSFDLEYFGLNENLIIGEVLDQEIEKAHKAIEDSNDELDKKIYAKADEKMRKSKPAAREGSWKWNTMEALNGKWKEFYEEYGIREIEKHNGRMRGYTPGPHHHKRKGFVFDPETGKFSDYYSDRVGNGQSFLETVIGMPKKDAWLNLAKRANIEPIDKCKYCEATIEWQNKKPLNPDGTAHRCGKEQKQTKEKKALQKYEEKKQESEKKGRPFSKIEKTIAVNKGTNYLVTDKGIFIEEILEKPMSDPPEYFSSYRLICSDPVMIEERLNDIFAEESYVKLSWSGKSKIIPTANLNTKNFDNLSKLGLRILTSNAKEMGAYFLASLQALDHEKQFATKNGWYKDGFICGNKIIYKDRETQIERKDDTLTAGTAGDKELWKKAIKRFTNDPQVQIVLGASAISPFISKLGLEGTTVHQFQDSSCGKTFLLRLAASMYGLPEKAEGETKGIIQGWYGTIVGHETYFNQMNNLPAFLDESQLARNQDIVFATIYNYANGFGKTRGTKEADLEKTKTWKGFLLSTGERKVTDVCNFGGLQARVIEIYRHKHEEISETEFIATNRTLAKNYGFGIEIIRYFLNNQESIENEYLNNLMALEKHFANYSGIQKRMLSKWAAILLGCEINLLLFGFDFNEEAFFAEMRKSLGGVEQKGSMSLYEYLMELYTSNKFHFWLRTTGGIDDSKVKDGTEIWGIYDVTEKFVIFFKDKLKELITKQGYAWSQLAILKEQGKLKTTQNTGIQYDVKINNIKHRTIAVFLTEGEESQS